MSIDSRIVLADLAEIYRESPRTDEMRVSVETISQKRTERMIVRTRPGEGAEIELGPVRIWTDLEHWYAVHKDVLDAYVRIPIENGDIIKTMEDSFPPMIVPQVVWMVTEGHVNDLCAAAKGTHWWVGEITSPCREFEGMASSASAIGSAGDRSIHAVLGISQAGENVFQLFEIEYPETGMKITVHRVEPTAPERETLGIGLEGRDALVSFEALLERAQDAAE